MLKLEQIAAPRLHSHTSRTAPSTPITLPQSAKYPTTRYVGFLYHPEGPSAYISDTLALKYSYRKHFKAKVYHVAVLGPSGLGIVIMLLG